MSTQQRLARNRVAKKLRLARNIAKYQERVAEIGKRIDPLSESLGDFIIKTSAPDWHSSGYYKLMADVWQEECRLQRRINAQGLLSAAIVFVIALFLIQALR